MRNQSQRLSRSNLIMPLPRPKYVGLAIPNWHTMTSYDFGQ